MRILISLTQQPDKRIINEIRSKGVSIIKTFKFTNTIGAEIEDERVLTSVKELDYVKEARPTEKARILIQNAVENIGVVKVLQEEIYGEGMLVSVTDSGMNLADPSLAYAVVAAEDFTGEGLFDSVGHGTLVSKIIKSVAPAVSFLNAKVVDSTNEADEMDLIAAIEWSCDCNADVINLSLGISRRCSSDCILCQTVNQVAKSGFHVVAAAGNDGPNRNTINCPGNAIHGLTIGAVDKEQKICEFSSRDSNNKPDLVAPGVINLGGFMALGTSIAVPFVSGSIALLLSKVKSKDIIEAMKQTAKDLGYPKYEQGYGLIQIDQALRWLE